MLILNGYLINAVFPIGSEGSSLKSGLTISILNLTTSGGEMVKPSTQCRANAKARSGC